MKILVVGSGGREHTLVWKLAQSKQVKQIFAAPGNAGIAEIAQCIDIAADDIKNLLHFVKDTQIDLTVVGPEAPLAGGIVDEFEKEGLRIFGPNALGARLEASKVFAKQIMMKAGVPTAQCEIFEDAQQAKDYIKAKGAPLVVKADGLAQGKGVIVAKTEQEAIDAVASIMENKIFGDAGNQVIIEECLTGEEASILAFCDGINFIPLASSQDHKRIFDNDQGPNTGGMGAYSPAPVISPKLMKEILNKIIKPVVDEMSKIGCPYKGLLYAGIMITKDGPKTLEFNVRFGDPETQVILPRLRTDLVKVMQAVIDGALDTIKLSWSKDSCVCIVASSGGYPGEYQKGKEISGLNDLKGRKGVMVFHAGTKSDNGKIVTSGGRVLGVTALGKDIRDAINNSYQAIEKIKFEGMHFRKDIGAKAIIE
ncbi:MAG: phosphoribosylamine--glycine ligase [Candidatus Omnitrophica bacterium]|nr:phosphoribosylamine--glycine ligase [Candidatus Omnitrophota bacterium]MDD5352907.1 phosphoribosylamine--glycine ligase [Candidatus Omnitrophota bacterium]MDD5550506.1 phosphoribosylamine--glycine ligase [Candidatus Omnitrophota bacterium]